MKTLKLKKPLHLCLSVARAYAVWMRLNGAKRTSLEENLYAVVTNVLIYAGVIVQISEIVTRDVNHQPKEPLNAEIKIRHRQRTGGRR